MVFVPRISSVSCLQDQFVLSTGVERFLVCTVATTCLVLNYELGSYSRNRPLERCQCCVYAYSCGKPAYRYRIAGRTVCNCNSADPLRGIAGPSEIWGARISVLLLSRFDLVLG